MFTFRFTAISRPPMSTSRHKLRPVEWRYIGVWFIPVFGAVTLLESGRDSDSLQTERSTDRIPLGTVFSVTPRMAPKTHPHLRPVCRWFGAIPSPPLFDNTGMSSVDIHPSRSLTPNMKELRSPNVGKYLLAEIAQYLSRLETSSVY
jgi:hypothetical protein